MAQGYVPGVAIALLTNYLTGYRVPLYERLADRYGVEVLCYGGGERYVPSWFSDLDAQLAAAPFPARRIGGPGAALGLARRYEAAIAPFAGGAMLPATYAGMHRARHPFVLWASVWERPRSRSHTLANPAIRRIYRHSDAVLAYGEHVKRFVASIRGRDDDVFVAPQSVEPEVFGRPVAESEISSFRRQNGLGEGPLVLYAGRLAPEKGISVLLAAWRSLRVPATLIVIGEGPLSGAVVATGRGAGGRVRLLSPRPRIELPVAYAAAEFTVLPSIPTPRFKEPWGLVCNESMHQGRPVIASDAVGAAAGGLVRDADTGLVVPAGDPLALRSSIERLLTDRPLRARLGTAAKRAVVPFNYDAMADAFGDALRAAAAID
jgi:glycosyltransferase involved in cell wall biosynthesis